MDDEVHSSSSRVLVAGEIAEDDYCLLVLTSACVEQSKVVVCSHYTLVYVMM